MTQATLLNTSWTLHRLSPLHHGKEFDSLLNNPLALKAYATRLRDQLSGTALSGGVQFGGALPTTEDDGLSRTGALKSCTWETVPNISFSEIEHESLESDDASDPLNAPRSRTRPRRPPHSPSPSHQGGGICVKLEYENITYKAALLTSSSLPASQSNPTTKPRTRTRSQTQTHSTRLPLLLTRFPAPLRQTFISFLSSTFDAYCSPLHLPPQFLGTALGTYIRALASEGLGTANPVNILKELHLTLSFSASVAPELRALNISIPRESLGGFLYAGDSGMGSESDVLSRLSAYLDGHLAMKLDLTGNATGPGPKGQQHVRLSRITCGGFSLGGDGKMKLVASPSTAGGDGEESSNGASSQTNRLALRACEVLLLDVVRRAAVDEDET